MFALVLVFLMVAQRALCDEAHVEKPDLEMKIKDQLTRLSNQLESRLIQLESRQNEVESRLSNQLDSKLKEVQSRLNQHDFWLTQVDSRLHQQHHVNSTLVAFFATAGGADYVPDDVIRFPHVQVNVNSDYNSENSTFTCSVPGLYYFVFNLGNYRGGANAVGHEAQLFRNNEVLTKVASRDLSEAENILQQSTSSVLVQLQPADLVYIKCVNIDSSVADRSNFSGFLLKET